MVVEAPVAILAVPATAETSPRPELKMPADNREAIPVILAVEPVVLGWEE
jgi:hypothetical protein